MLRLFLLYVAATLPISRGNHKHGKISAQRNHSIANHKHGKITAQRNHSIAAVSHEPKGNCSSDVLSADFSGVISQSVDMAAKFSCGHHKDHKIPSLISAVQLAASVYSPIIGSSLALQARNLTSSRNNPADLRNATIIVAASMIEVLRQSVARKGSLEARLRESTESFFRTRHQQRWTSFVSNPNAVDELCDAAVENTTKKATFHRPKTAVCLVGVPRTIARRDVRDSLMYRFLSGWGLRGLQIFSVLGVESLTNIEPSTIKVLKTLR